MTIASLVEALGIPPSEIMTASVAERAVSVDYVVQEGDVVELYPVLAGG